MANKVPPCREDQQKLLQEARAVRDAFVLEKTRVEGLLISAIEKVKIYQTLLGTTQSQICQAEDLIGDIRMRLRRRGTASFVIFTPPPPLLSMHETTGGEGITD